MRTIKINVTTLDYFNKINWENDKKVEDFISSIVSPPPPLPNMIIGSAFHYFLQNPQIEPPYVFSQGGNSIEIPENLLSQARSWFYYQLQQKKLCKKARSIVWEVRGASLKWIKRIPVEIVGIVDGIGAGLIEIKTTQYYSFDNYQGSVQWKFYLDIFNMPFIDYFVFELNNGAIQSMNNFRFYDSEFCKRGLTLLIEDFLDFCNDRKLISYFYKNEED